MLPAPFAQVNSSSRETDHPPARALDLPNSVNPFGKKDASYDSSVLGVLEELSSEIELPKSSCAPFLSKIT